MINHIFDIDNHIITSILDVPTLKSLRCTNKYYHQYVENQLIYSLHYDILSKLLKNEQIIKIFGVKASQHCTCCKKNKGVYIHYFCQIKNDYYDIDYFTACLIYDARLNVIDYDSYEELKTKVKKYYNMDITNDFKVDNKLNYNFNQFYHRLNFFI